jgi:SAM-dependent methyltransferase
MGYPRIVVDYLALRHSSDPLSPPGRLLYLQLRLSPDVDRGMSGLDGGGEDQGTSTSKRRWRGSIGTSGRCVLIGSASLDNPTYWWYVARTRLLHRVLGSYVTPGARVLDVGSADGPSVSWLGERVAVDMDPRGLRPGDDVCAAVEALPFADDRFEVVSAFDVVEHCEDEVLALSELRRVATPGGVVLLSVPAYQWMWSRFDVRAGHYRRYTRSRLRRATQGAGLKVERATYVFASTLPFFLAARLLTKLKGAGGERVQPLPSVVERLLLAITKLDEALLRRWNLPAGSSVVMVARKVPS